MAAYPPDEVADHLAARIAQLHVGRAAADGVNTRLTSATTWHVTLVFLGEVREHRLDDVRTAVGVAIGGAVADGRPPPILRVAGGGHFGRGNFTVLWAGLTGDVPLLTELALGVRRALRRARVPYDEKPPRPHLTLARPGGRLPPTDIAADIAALDGYAGPQWTVDRVRLMRSHLGPKPTYDELGAWGLRP